MDKEYLNNYLKMYSINASDLTVEDIQQILNSKHYKDYIKGKNIRANVLNLKRELEIIFKPIMNLLINISKKIEEFYDRKENRDRSCKGFNKK